MKRRRIPKPSPRSAAPAPCPKAYRLDLPASPHLSAEAEGAAIDLDRLALPQVNGPMVVEGAGGIMVPLTRQVTYLDMFVRWGAPVILVARTQLGTINHTALSLMALRSAGVSVVGVCLCRRSRTAGRDTICNHVRGGASGPPTHA